MKIRTKIICISSAAVLGAILLVSAVILRMVKVSRDNEAYMKAYQSSYMALQSVEKELERVSADGEDANSKIINYLMKRIHQEGSYVCIQTDGLPDYPKAVEEVYNNTVFSAKELLNAEYKGIKEDGFKGYGKLSYGGGQYLFFRGGFFGSFEFFGIEDVTYVQEDMDRLMTGLLAASVGVMVVTVFILFLVLRRVFLPLQKLNDSAKQIAEGVYNQRVEIQKKDEIGELGASFNRMAEAVEEHTRCLEESEMRKTLFMGNLTHELKTPMTVISGYAQTLLRVKLDEQEQEEALLYIHEECQRLERLSKKMMRLLELEGGESISFQEVSAARLFEAVEKSGRLLLREKEIQLVFQETGERFLVDFDLMMEVLLNLIDNGMKASHPGGKIVVSAYDNCISVEDFGRGIPTEEQEHIFEPFYMVDKSRSRKSGGAGLGLALTALIAKQHHIEIQVDSEEGRGTKIILQFVYNAMNT